MAASEHFTNASTISVRKIFGCFLGVLSASGQPFGMRVIVPVLTVSYLFEVSTRWGSFEECRRISRK